MSKNAGYLKQLHKLQIQHNALSLALPRLRAAGEQLEGQSLIDQVDVIGQECGLADLL